MPNRNEIESQFAVERGPLSRVPAPARVHLDDRLILHAASQAAALARRDAE